MAKNKYGVTYDTHVSDRLRHDRRLAAGLCYKCGKNPVTSGMKTCEECRRKVREYVSEYKIKNAHKYTYNNKKEIPVIVEKRTKPKYTLDQMCAMARERGISYGQLVQQMERDCTMS